MQETRNCGHQAWKKVRTSGNPYEGGTIYSECTLCGITKASSEDGTFYYKNNIHKEKRRLNTARKQYEGLTIEVKSTKKNRKHTGSWTPVDWFILVEVTGDGLVSSGYFVKTLKGEVENFNFSERRLTPKEIAAVYETVEQFVETAPEPTEEW